MSKVMIVRSMSELDVGKLMNVYSEGQSLSRIDDFYHRLMSFFRLKDAFYAVMEDEGIYCSALRAEPYMDGMIITGLETSPDMRGRGYASELMNYVLDMIFDSHHCNVYSHVEQKNEISMRIHKRCGFYPVKDYAVFLDGSVSATAVTLCKKNTADTLK